MEIKIEHKRFCGIYYIMNMTNGKIYIGSSIDIYYRLYRHKSDLHKNRHANRYLRNAFNKYGTDNFVGGILMLCDAEDLLKFEEYYINFLDADYNLMREIIRHSLSAYSRSLISSTLKKKYASGEIVTYKQEHRWKTVYIYDLSGKYVNEYVNVVEAARILDLNKESIRRAAEGSYRRVGNYQARYIKADKLTSISFTCRCKSIIYEHPEGVIKASSMVKLARILNVNRGSLAKAIKRGKYKGYPLYWPL